MLYPEDPGAAAVFELWFDSISLSLGFLKNNEVGFYALERYSAVFPESPCLASVSARDRGENQEKIGTRAKRGIKGEGGGAYHSPEKTVALVYFIDMYFLQLYRKNEWSY